MRWVRPNTEATMERISHSLIRSRQRSWGMPITTSHNAMHISTFLVVLSIHGHRTLKAPHPVRSAQLTRVPPS